MGKFCGAICHNLPMTLPQTLAPYDAVLFVSFGGPEGPDEVMPFLETVANGRDIPRPRLEQVAEHYYARGGISPINQQCRDLLAALRDELDRRGIDTPIHWGNRNSAPWLVDAVRRLADEGARRVLVVTTGAYPSYSSCRQYLENVWDAGQQVVGGGGSITFDRIRHYAQHPGFLGATVDGVLDSLTRLGTPLRPEALPRLVFVTHSIPEAMSHTSGPEPRSEEGSYVDWHLQVAAEVAMQVGRRVGTDPAWDLVYCSRSGAPGQAWLEPDVCDHLREIAEEGVREAVLVPIGFISDHMEVVNDLDEEALSVARDAGVRAVRAATVGTHPQFVAALADLMLERAQVANGMMVLPRVTDGGSPGRYDCPATCCPNLREPGRPAICQAQ